MNGATPTTTTTNGASSATPAVTQADLDAALRVLRLVNDESLESQGPAFRQIRVELQQRADILREQHQRVEEKRKRKRQRRAEIQNAARMRKAQDKVNANKCKIREQRTQRLMQALQHSSTNDDEQKLLTGDTLPHYSEALAALADGHQVVATTTPAASNKKRKRNEPYVAYSKPNADFNDTADALPDSKRPKTLEDFMEYKANPGNVFELATAAPGEFPFPQAPEKSEAPQAPKEDGKSTSQHSQTCKLPCHVCKKEIGVLDEHYDKLCRPCAALNRAKREQTADLTGRVILLTGARVKIGYAVALKLLRAGATVLATSRFPHDCAARFATVSDFKQWKDRLVIFGLDMRDLSAVIRFTTLLSSRYHRLDAIINNAAQTLRRPPAFYRHLMAHEMKPSDELQPDQASLLGPDPHHKPEREGTRPRLTAAAASDSLSVNTVTISDASSSDPLSDPMSVDVSIGVATDASDDDMMEIDADNHVSHARDASRSPGIPDAITAQSIVVSKLTALAGTFAPTYQGATSAVLSQIPLMPGDEVHDPAHFPEGKLDADRQQLDLRPTNSWKLLLHEIDPIELVEVFAINALAPFILVSRLKPLMIQTGKDVDKYIINVSAMEGKFYRAKSPQHPHTNMAKAALNMMTRTSAADYANDRIYMNSVDTGWIHDENPMHIQLKRADDGFQTPLNEEDAAARILDPIFVGVRTGFNPYGQFYKDYRVSDW